MEDKNTGTEESTQQLGILINFGSGIYNYAVTDANECRDHILC